MNDKNVKTWDVNEINPQVEIGDVVKKYNEQFVWTEKHLKGSELLPLAKQGDVLADNALPFLEKKGKSHIESLRKLAISPDCPPEVLAFYNHLITVPDWVDFDQITRGQEFFWENFTYIALFLQTSALIANFTAHSIANVLSCTGYMGSPTASFRRSAKTVQMVAESMQRGELKPWGKGWESIIDTRLVHCQVRRHIKRMIEKGNDKIYLPPGFVPISQEDLYASLMSFSLTILLCFDKMVIECTSQQREDFVATYRYIAYIMGIEDKNNLLRNFESSLALKQSLDMHLKMPDAKSSKMTANVLNIPSRIPPFYLKFDNLVQTTRFFVGDELANDLHLPQSKPGLSLSFKLTLYTCVYLQNFMSWCNRKWALNLIELEVIKLLKSILGQSPKYQSVEYNDKHDYPINLPKSPFDYVSSRLFILIFLFLVIIFKLLQLY